jgi:hypothetical protein
LSDHLKVHSRGGGGDALNVNPSNNVQLGGEEEEEEEEPDVDDDEDFETSSTDSSDNEQI